MIWMLQYSGATVSVRRNGVWQEHILSTVTGVTETVAPDIFLMNLNLPC